MNGTQYGLWFGLNAMTVFLANLMAARLTHFHSLERIVHTGLIIIVSACMVMAYLNTHGTTVLKFMLPMLGMTIGIGISMGCSVALALRDFDELSGIATSIVSACQFGISALFGAIIAQTNLSPVSLALPVLVISIIGLVSTRVKLNLMRV